MLSIILESAKAQQRVIGFMLMNFWVFVKDKFKHKGWFLVGVWVVIGAVLRFLNLGEKSASSIEISTVVFGLGQGLQNIPLNQVISTETLLSPLIFSEAANSGDVIEHLFRESNHPPLYFLLTHWWMNLFFNQGDLVSVEVGRSLSALWGILTIPAVFGLSWLGFRSRTVAQISAALMAVSPYGIYLAQEARHYTLSLLWIIASLSCFVFALQCRKLRKLLPIWIVLTWVGVNSLGIATHYFFALTLAAEALVIVGFWLKDLKTESQAFGKYWRRIFAVGLGTAFGGLIWLPIIQNIPNDELTEWINTDLSFVELFQPLIRLLGWWVTMVFMLPVEGISLGITILSGLILLLGLIWIIPAIIRGVRVHKQGNLTRIAMQSLGGVVLSAIALILILIYGLGKDLSLAARYHFVYFPPLIIIVAAAFAICWQESSDGVKWGKLPMGLQARGKKVVIVALILGLMGGLTVSCNYGYQKSKRSDLLASYILQQSDVPILVAMTQRTHAETRTAIALGLEFQRLNPPLLPQFLLVEKTENSVSKNTAVSNALTQFPRPFDFWTVELKDDTQIEAFNCILDPRSRPDINGYRYRQYHCQSID